MSKILPLKRNYEYVGVTEESLDVTNIGRYYGALRGDLSTWSYGSTDPLPDSCIIPDINPPQTLPLDLTMPLVREIFLGEVGFSVEPIMQWAAKENYDMSDVDFVVSRGPLRDICITLYRKGIEWEFWVYKYRNKIFIVTPTEDKVAKLQELENTRVSMPDVWGKKFEDFMKTGGCGTAGYLGEDVDPRVVRLTKLGEHNILTVARVSCQNQEQGGPANYVELKTHCKPTTEWETTKIYRRKYLLYWAHCALVGINKVYVGIRTEEQLVEIKPFSTDDLQVLGQWSWNADISLSFTDDLFTWLKGNLDEGYCYTLSYGGRGSSHVQLTPNDYPEFIAAVQKTYPEC